MEIFMLPVVDGQVVRVVLNRNKMSEPMLFHCELDRVLIVRMSSLTAPGALCWRFCE